MFCGKYKTEVPEGYFAHLSESRGKKRKITAAADATTATGRSDGSTLVANGGPVNVASETQQQNDKAHLGIRSKGGEADSADANGETNGADERSPENREDIRYGYLLLCFGLFLFSLGSRSGGMAVVGLAAITILFEDLSRSISRSRHGCLYDVEAADGRVYRSGV